MNYLTIYTRTICGFLFLILTENISAQEITISVSQDSKFEALLAEKRKINVGNVANNRYKIQLFSGDNESAKKVLTDFRKENKYIDGTIVFNTPNYKVWVGNFKTRIEAERNLIELRKKYSNLLLIKPNN